MSLFEIGQRAIFRFGFPAREQRMCTVVARGHDPVDGAFYRVRFDDGAACEVWEQQLGSVQASDEPEPIQPAPERRHRKRMKRLLVLATCLVLVLGAATLGWFYIQQGHELRRTHDALRSSDRTVNSLESRLDGVSRELQSAEEQVGACRIAVGLSGRAIVELTDVITAYNSFDSAIEGSNFSGAIDALVRSRTAFSRLGDIVESIRDPLSRCRTSVEA